MFSDESPNRDVQTPLALGQPTTPPSSPVPLPSKRFATLSDAQELVKAVIDMQVASAYAPKCTCAHTPPEDPSEAALTDFYSPSLCPTFPTNQPSQQIVTTEHVQQFLDILKFLSTKQGPPPPAAADKIESENPLARASKLEFKTVNEVYVFNAAQVQV
jgi:hypothetical protein